MHKLCAGIIVAVLLCSVAQAAPGAAAAGSVAQISVNGCATCGGGGGHSINWHIHWGHWGGGRSNSCGCCKCCPKVPEYPVVCAHDHEDMHRDLVSRQHAPWW